MRTYRKSVIKAVLLVAALAACGPKPDSATDTAAGAVASTASADRTADADAIKRLDEQWLSWAVAKNVDSMLTLYTADARSFMAGQKPITDADGRRKAYNDFVAMNLRDAKMQNMATEFSDDGTVAYSYGTYSGTMTVGGGDIKDEGSYVNIWRRTPSGWRMVVEISNSSVPMGPPPADAKKK